MLRRMLAIDRSGLTVTTTLTRAPGASGNAAGIDGAPRLPTPRDPVPGRGFSRPERRTALDPRSP